MWLRELRTHSNPDSKVFVIGNKIYLEDERQIKKEEDETLSKENKIEMFIEYTAKTGLNTQNIFLKVAKILCDNYHNKVKYDDENYLNIIDYMSNDNKKLILILM